MVRRYFLIVLMLLMLHPAMAVWVKTEFDYKGATAAEAAYLAVQKAENLNLQSIEEILKHYTSAEIASAGIHAAKFLERKALKDVRIFGTEENHYYKVILWIVSKRIIPRTLRIGKECLNHPDKFLYWGPYLFRVCQDTQNKINQTQQGLQREFPHAPDHSLAQRLHPFLKLAHKKCFFRNPLQITCKTAII